MFKGLAERIPGTEAHADNVVREAFKGDEFDESNLTTSEAAILEQSLKEKYIPAMRNSMRAKYLGLVIGALAPFEFLLIGAVTLAASASSTTGAWYSITLKEMKAKFEKMGLNLSSKLLKADMMANALSMYSGVGFAYRKIAYPEVEELINHPSTVNALRATVALVASGLIHGSIRSIIRNKETASIQFDFNDATLGGMTEEQQRFFSHAINEVNLAMSDIKSSRDNIALNRATLKCLTELQKLIKKFDIEDAHKETFAEIEAGLKSQENEYGENLDPFLQLAITTLEKILGVLDLEDEQRKAFLSKVQAISTTNTPQKFIAILSDIIPEITKFLEGKGEKGVKLPSHQN